MLTKKIKKTLLISAILVIAGTSVAFARGGCGYGDGTPGYGQDCDGPRGGYGMMGGGPGNSGGGYGANLTEEQRAKVDAAREKFFTETDSLRIQIRDKHFALQDEMNKKEPDNAKILQLQKELSTVQAEFDQKAVLHRLEMRQLLPESGRGPGFGRGFGGRCQR